MNYLISGGGTGGHIFPAISIANALRELQPDCNILFVGAEDRMEMERVPQAGYEIKGLPIRGFYRKQLWKNISVLWDLQKSLRKARKIIKEFKPDVAIGVGGYASAAAMKAAARMGIPVVLQEQNGFAGVTNKLLGRDATKICVAYENMERFFPAHKLILTGNPVRQHLDGGNKTEAIEYFGLNPNKKTLLIIGGSLGARTINESIIANLDKLATSNIQVIWQTGKAYFEQCRKALIEYKQQHTLTTTEQYYNQEQIRTEEGTHLGDNILCTAFISRMDLAFAAANLVISRAGASSISELCLLGKPSILVPSPNVAEDHQTHNAMALVNKNAAILVKDIEAKEQLVDNALRVIQNTDKLEALHQNVLTLAQPDSANRIAKEIIALTNKK